MSKIIIPVCGDDVGRIVGTLAIIGMMIFIGLSSYWVWEDTQQIIAIVVTILFVILEIMFVIMLFLLWDKIEWLEDNWPIRFKSC